MSQLFASGHAVDLILAILAIEGAAMLWRGWGIADVIGRLVPGAMLLLALRCALTGADYRWIALCLSASFPAHLFDLVRRGGR